MRNFHDVCRFYFQFVHLEIFVSLVTPVLAAYCLIIRARSEDDSIRYVKTKVLGSTSSLEIFLSMIILNILSFRNTINIKVCRNRFSGKRTSQSLQRTSLTKNSLKIILRKCYFLKKFFKSLRNFHRYMYYRILADWAK